MSRHLRVLLDAGIVVDERIADDARVRVFHLRPDSIVAITSWLDQIRAHWDEQLRSFKRYVEDEGRHVMNTTSTSVEVAVDPATAFMAFTEELDMWWVRGPINHFDSARAVGMRCEPGVGGRLIEVYDDETGEGLDLGRITIWEPGVRLAWTSSVDDVAIDVRFLRSEGGTEVTVVATVPDGGEDRGGTAWVRVVPKWFPQWCERRDTAPGRQRELGRLSVGVYYAKPAAASRAVTADARAMGVRRRPRRSSRPSPGSRSHDRAGHPPDRIPCLYR